MREGDLEAPCNFGKRAPDTRVPRTSPWCASLMEPEWTLKSSAELRHITFSDPSLSECDCSRYPSSSNALLFHTHLNQNCTFCDIRRASKHDFFIRISIRMRLFTPRLEVPTMAFYYTSQSECDFTPHVLYSVERRFRTPPKQNYMREGRTSQNHSVFSSMS